MAAEDARKRTFDIKFTEGAIEDLQVFSELEQRRIVAALASLLADAAHETKNRKRLHPNAPAEWEMRIRTVRVFYDIDYNTSTVKIECIGRLFYPKVLLFRNGSRDKTAARKSTPQDVRPTGKDKSKNGDGPMNDFGEEIKMTRATSLLIALLKKRAKQPPVLSFRELKKRLGMPE